MKMMKTLVTGLAVATSLALTAPAALADGYEGAKGYKPAYAPVYNWSGLYFGGSVGASFGSMDYAKDFPGFVGFRENFGHDIDGWIAGGHIGIQRQFGQFVLGAEVSLSGVENDSRIGYALQVPAFERAKVSWLFTATAKAGMTLNPSLLAYVRAGYASADIGARLIRLDNGVEEGGGHDREHGWTVGVGLDWMFMKNIMLGIEYNYYTFDADNRLNRLSNGNPVTTENLDVELHAITARLTFLLGHNHDAPAPLK